MEEVENKMTIVTEKTIKVVPAVGGISKLSELEIDVIADAAASMNIESLPYAALRCEALDTSYIVLIYNHDNLSDFNLQSILDHTNLTIQKGQECVDKMANPAKIGTGGRRGIIGDDFDDNKLTNRDKSAAVATTLDIIVQILRPEWTTAAGTPAVSTGILALGASVDMYFPSSIDTGAWEWRLMAQNHSGVGGDDYYINFIYQDASNTLDVNYNPSSSTGNGLEKDVAGTKTSLIAGALQTANTWNNYKVTRDANGNFEYFINDVSQGTATDTFLPAIASFRISCLASTQTDNVIDWLKIV